MGRGRLAVRQKMTVPDVVGKLSPCAILPVVLPLATLDDLAVKTGCGDDSR